MEIIGTLSGWVAFMLALVSIVDRLLSNSRKEHLTDSALLVWNWLANQRAGSFIPTLWSRSAQGIILGFWLLYAVATGVLGALIHQSGALLAQLALSLAALVLVVRPRLVRAIRRPQTLFGYFRTLTLWWVGWGIAYAALLVGTVLVVGDSPRELSIAYVIKAGEQTPFPVTAIVFGAGLIFISIYFALLISLFWLALVLVLTALLAVAEVALRFVLEQPGGAIAGVVVLLGLLSGLLNAG